MDDLVRTLAARLKAAFTLHAALSAEADLARLDAERRVELLRQADRMEAEGLNGPAEALRQRVARLDELEHNGVPEERQPPLAALPGPGNGSERKKK